ncbi:hypothetical protein [Hymenobacter koreensis]|uniref:GAF domain-containing protein n=1 Tax=Hymenobacter koreensis TaxID=1084523 RepID=A0ABP8JNJ3_9BACT
MLPPTLIEWLQKLPVWLGLGMLVLWMVFQLVREPLQKAASQFIEHLTRRLLQARKEPNTQQLVNNSRKAILLEQTAERMRIELDCDHVSVYAVQNGEYLRTGDSVEKLVMIAEASRPGDPRYMEVERIIYAQSIPRLLMVAVMEPFVLLWQGKCDDWKMNQLMTERDYASCLAVCIRRPNGVIGMFKASWRDKEVYRADHAPHTGDRLLDDEMRLMLHDFALELSYQM